MTPYSVTALFVFAALTISQMAVLKGLYLFLWSRMAMLDDDFVANMLNRFNILVTFLTVMTRVYLGEHRQNRHVAAARGEAHKEVINTEFYSTVFIL